MLEQLFGSKTRVKLLSLFFNNPSRSFYVREITRKINEQINSVRRELANLQNLGIVVSLPKNGKLYYGLSSKYEFVKEFRSIFKAAEVPQKEDTEEKLTVKFKRTGSLDMVLLMGFFVQDNESPVDIFVVGKADKKKIQALIKDLEKDAGKELNYCTMTKEEYDYRKALYDRFLINIMAHPKITLINKFENVGALNE